MGVKWTEGKRSDKAIEKRIFFRRSNLMNYKQPIATYPEISWAVYHAALTLSPRSLATRKERSAMAFHHNRNHLSTSRPITGCCLAWSQISKVLLQVLQYATSQSSKSARREEEVTNRIKLIMMSSPIKVLYHRTHPETRPKFLITLIPCSERECARKKA